jgi:hypothetical protein
MPPPPPEQLVTPLVLNDEPETLPFRVDLWEMNRQKVERLLAKVASAALAQAIFEAALHEYPKRYITVQKGSRLIAQSPSDSRVS